VSNPISSPVASSVSRSIRVAVVSSAVFLLAGCASAPSISAPVDQTPAPAPTPSATQPTDPADPTEWVVDFDGIGPVNLGASLSSTRPLLSAYVDETDQECPTARFGAVGQPSVWVFGESDHDTIRMILLSGDATASEFAETSPKTAEGIGIGSPKNAISEAYPTAIERYNEGETTRPSYSVSNGSGQWMHFITDDAGVVSLIELGPREEKSYEYCG
jgi:hypothetical protein